MEKQNNEGSYDWLNGIVFFDIETEPNKSMLVESLIPEFSAPSNYKDPDKIQQYIDQKQENFVEIAPLDLDFAQIKAIGVARGNENPIAYVADESEAWSEAQILHWFWRFIRNAKTIAGYNIAGFDIPIILRRSFVLGLTPTRPLFGLKPWDKIALDLMRALYHDGYGPGVKYRGLKWVCRAYGIETDWDVHEVDGSMVQGLSTDELRAYVISDVAKTRALAIKMHGHYW